MRYVVPIVAVVCALLALPAQAADGIVLEVRELTIGGIPVKDVSARLDVLDEKHTRVTLGARTLEIAKVGKFENVAFTCVDPVIAEPRFGCPEGKLSGRGGPTGSIDMNAKAEMRTDTGITTFSGNGLRLAGTTAAFAGQLDARGWRVHAKTGSAKAVDALAFAKPWFQMPKGYTITGLVQVDVDAADLGKGMSADIAAALTGADFTNEESTIVGEKIDASVKLHATPRAKDTGVEIAVTGTKGQALLGPVFLDLGVNPLDANLSGTLAGDVLSVDALAMKQKDLLTLAGKGSVNLGGDVPLVSGDFDLSSFQFPAGYTSFVQITLAASMLGNLDTHGSMRGEISVRDNVPTALSVYPHDVELHDRKGQLHLSKLNGELHWAPAGGVDARLSKLSWASGGAYGLSGGSAEIEFVAYGANFALARPVKLPVFDGAIAMDTFALGNLGAKDMEVSFKGKVEPISMKLLSKAFGWPEFSGSLAAEIPGVTLKNNVLTFDGTLESQVFGGRIEGSNIRLQDPLGNFPQLFADVRARDLDLGLVTQTFEVGSITGKLEADVLGLELFGWTPQRFDARLATPKGDKSKHRISAKAVSSLSNVGGGGGGVVQALQSGVLKFFDEYSYDKLGITCRLRGDVCQMSGVEPAPNGYYIVKGSGLPRIDIVGNQGRVNWNQLLSSISTANFGDANVN